jgi:copper transport protein
VESLGAVLVLALTAMLVDAEPGRTALASAPASGPVHAVVRYDSGGTNGAGALDVRVDPARTGPDTISVLVHGLDNAPREVPELKAALRLPARRLGPLPVVLTRTGTGRYLGTTQIPLPGVWQLALTVRTSDFDETRVTVAVRVS